jgi:FkbM family methyltransferase
MSKARQPKPGPLTSAAVRILRDTSFRGKYRLMNWIVPHQGETTGKIAGSLFRLDLSDHIQWNVYCGLYESQESGWVAQHLRAGMTFVDVGANIGYYTALASSLVGPAGQVFAFEPSPYAAQRLNMLKKENSLSNVKVFESGVSDTIGETTLHLQRGSRNHSPTMVPIPNCDSVTVPLTTLDRFAQENGLSQIDLLKIDVEGYEHHVLKGAHDLLSRGSIKAVLCEFNDYWLRGAKTTISQVEDLLASAGLTATQQCGLKNLENRLYVHPTTEGGSKEATPKRHRSPAGTAHAAK